MDVAYEMLQVRRKVQVQINRQALEAEARVYDMDPLEYAAMRAKERAEREADAREKAIAAVNENGAALGRQLRQMADGWKSMLEGVARGFNGG